MQNHFNFFDSPKVAVCGQVITDSETSDIEKEITCPKCEKRYFDLFDILETIENDDPLPDYYDILN